MKIQAIKTDMCGDWISDCADDEADTFLILDADDTEIMRASSRPLAESWIEKPWSE